MANCWTIARPEGLLCGDRVGRRAEGIENLPHLGFILGNVIRGPLD